MFNIEFGPGWERRLEIAAGKAVENAVVRALTTIDKGRLAPRDELFVRQVIKEIEHDFARQWRRGVS